MLKRNVKKEKKERGIIFRSSINVIVYFYPNEVFEFVTECSSSLLSNNTIVTVVNYVILTEIQYFLTEAIKSFVN